MSIVVRRFQVRCVRNLTNGRVKLRSIDARMGVGGAMRVLRDILEAAAVEKRRAISALFRGFVADAVRWARWPDAERD
jgi:hypothetical protein